MSLGIAENISALSFRNNSFFCSSGKYGLTDDSELVEVRPCTTRCTTLLGLSYCSSNDRCMTLLQNLSRTIDDLVIFFRRDPFVHTFIVSTVVKVDLSIPEPMHKWFLSYDCFLKYFTLLSIDTHQRDYLEACGMLTYCTQNANTRHPSLCASPLSPSRIPIPVVGVWCAPGAPIHSAKIIQASTWTILRYLFVLWCRRGWTLPQGSLG